MSDFWEQVQQIGIVNMGSKQPKVEPQLFCEEVLEMAKLTQKPLLTPTSPYYREAERNPN